VNGIRAAIASFPSEGDGVAGREGWSVASSATLSSGVAGRYATALFEIARDGGSLAGVESDMNALGAALADSADLRDMIASPVFARDEMVAAITAIARRMELGPEVTNTLGLMAQNRRLFVLPAFISSVKAMIAADRGEITAEVVSAKPLTEGQVAKLRDTLKASVGKDVELDLSVDETLIGGLVVRLGSRMIDSSIRSKLANLQNVMKEVG
jgi:F-type H+-transporting ATPase subunit delta